MDHASASFTSPWAAAVLSQHAMNPTNIEHGFGHHGLTMDYSYYRCGLNWTILFSLRSCHVLLLRHTLTLLLSKKRRVDRWQTATKQASRLNSKLLSFVWNETFFKIIYVMCLPSFFSVVCVLHSTLETYHYLVLERGRDSTIEIPHTRPLTRRSIAKNLIYFVCQIFSPLLFYIIVMMMSRAVSKAPETYTSSVSLARVDIFM